MISQVLVMIALVFEGLRVNGRKLWRTIRAARPIARHAHASLFERMPHHGRGGQDHGLAEVAFEPVENRDGPLRRNRARRNPVSADLRHIRALDANWCQERTSNLAHSWLKTNDDSAQRKYLYQQKYQHIRLRRAESSRAKFALCERDFRSTCLLRMRSRPDAGRPASALTTATLLPSDSDFLSTCAAMFPSAPLFEENHSRQAAAGLSGRSTLFPNYQFSRLQSTIFQPRPRSSGQ